MPASTARQSHHVSKAGEVDEDDEDDVGLAQRESAISSPSSTTVRTC
ncbi:hypothetical protein [Streptomyces sp. ICN441]|nr:hypothetical protein [Streptomyces sp. ICN441]